MMKMSPSLRKYLRDFENGDANPHKIKVRIRLNGLGEFDSPLKLTPAGKLSKAVVAAVRSESKDGQGK